MSAEAPHGLDPALAAARLREEGPNELGLSQRRTLRDIAREVLREPMFGLLLGAGAIYLAMGDAREALILLGFVFVIMGITALQERRTDKALDALRDLSSPRALVLRGGASVRIPGREVVRGDMLLLAEGDRVPADGRLLQAHELAIDESMLTGESEAVAKQAPADRVFAGTLVVSGQGMMQVDAVGRQTEMGRIGVSLQNITLQASPLRDEVAKLTRRLVVIALSLSVALMGLFWLLRGGWLTASTTRPPGLPAPRRGRHRVRDVGADHQSPCGRGVVLGQASRHRQVYGTTAFSSAARRSMARVIRRKMNRCAGTSAYQ